MPRPEGWRWTAAAGEVARVSGAPAVGVAAVAQAAVRNRLFSIPYYAAYARGYLAASRPIQRKLARVPARRLRVVARGSSGPRPLAPRAGDRARRAAEVGDDLAGAAAGAAGLRVGGAVGGCGLSP